MDLQLSSRVAVVTGASKGIGLAITRTLITEGARVVAASRKAAPELDALAGADLDHVAVDLMDPEAPAQVVARAREAFGGLDILVNNAGGPPPGVTLPRGSFLDATDDQWQAMFEFNLFSAVRAVRAAIPLMLKRGGGAIEPFPTSHVTNSAPCPAGYGVAASRRRRCQGSAASASWRGLSLTSTRERVRSRLKPPRRSRIHVGGARRRGRPE